MLAGPKDTTRARRTAKEKSAGNYGYDKIGNLIRDNAEGLDSVRWTVYGKINRIRKSSGAFLNYGYDPGGNRTFKQYVSGGSPTNTYYVRDAQGNVLAIYEKAGTNALKWSEQHLYGSSRLGMWKWDTVVPASAPVVVGSGSLYDSLLYGARSYELSNHLGNILATISDKKIGNDSSGVVNYYLAEALSQNDYYPFGMLQPGRQYGVLGRYGFNGKENDNEVKGEGGQQDYGMRIYDPRVGRFLSVDRIGNCFPWNSPYSYSENDPINFVDLDGSEKASPASVDMAKQLSQIIGNRIENSQEKLKNATDESLKEKIKIDMELDRKTYSALMVFIYKNNPSKFEVAVDVVEKTKPIVKEGLDFTPAGDIKVVLTGKNFVGEDRSRLGAVGWLALDVFGAEIISGLGKAARSARVLTGPGKEVIERVVKKINNISTALDETHIRAAVNDIFGKPVVIGGKVYDHLSEVRNALKGLGNQISELNKLINNSKTGRDVIEAATDLRNTLQKQKDQINAVLDRATNAVNKSK